MYAACLHSFYRFIIAYQYFMFVLFPSEKVVNIIEMLKRGRQHETNFKSHLPSPSNPSPKSRHPTTTCRPSLATRKGLFRAARRRCRHINCRNRARIRRLVQGDDWGWGVGVGSGVGGLGLVQGLGVWGFAGWGVKGDVYTSFWSYSPGEL